MSDIKRSTRRWLPPVAALGLILLFARLAAWQLDRAAEKEALAGLFDGAADYAAYVPDRDYALYERVRATGRYVGEQQFLIDNIVTDRTLGYYVITPLERRPGEPLLLVNRGFVPRGQPGGGLPDIAVGAAERAVAGRVGRLPRVAIRPDEPITPGQGWPKTAVYPQTADIAAALGRPVADTVVLLSPGEPDGYRRQWQPDSGGPMMHYGYAFQWSALALTVFVILVWQLRKRHRDD